LPVVEGNTVVGIITESDIFRAYVRLAEGVGIVSPAHL
jgi:CBS domain-containing protein